MENRNNEDTPNQFYESENFEAGYNDLDRERYHRDTDKDQARADSGYNGTLNEYNRGRDYETNAGYRDSYNRLATGDWPEIERAQREREDESHRTMPGGVTHRGKGPRSYQRSDDRIREDINDLLSDDPYVDASDVDISVEKGEVMVTGTVDDKHAKRRLEDLIESVSGVKDVQNRLRTRMSGGQIVNIRNSQA